MLKSKCQECSEPNCEGQGELRVFRDWKDLSAHLGEEDIVRLINHLATIGEEYAQLKERQLDQRVRNRAMNLEQRMLRRFAKENMTEDERETIHQRALQLALGKEETDASLPGDRPRLVRRRKAQRGGASSEGSLHINVVREGT